MTTEIPDNLFKHLVGGVIDYAIFALDPQGYIISWNPGAERIKGYAPDEIIGKHFSVFYTQEARNRFHPDFELKEALAKGSYEEEGWRIRKNGQQFWANVVITALFDDDRQHIGFAKVTRDLTERRTAQIFLERARDDALLANQLKSEFVANVTHEIRTPLSGIVGLSQLIAYDEGASPATKDGAKRIFEASKQLLSMLNDLLDVAKLEAGKMNLELISYSPASVINEVIGLNKLNTEAKSIGLVQTLRSDVPKEITGDPGKIRQVLLNLVSNAIKFTDSGGVEIAVDSKNDAIQYSVTDTGIGIPQTIQEKLFKPFVQGDESTSRLFGGTGLGLSIAQKYVELMRGEIGITSEPGKGTTVWFSIPLHYQ